MPAFKDASLGRLRFVTVFDDIQENPTGGAVEIVGGQVISGETRPEPFQLTLPIRAAKGETVDAGFRVRRQAKAMLSNAKLLREGLWWTFDQDPEQNGWLRIGGGQITANDGRLIHADYKLQLQDSYRLATPATHRPARLVRLYDIRLASQARDTLGTIRSTDFAGQDATPKVTLPAGATDLTGAAGRVVQPAGTIATTEGELKVVTDVTNREVISYEQPESHRHRADVVIYDRRGA